MEVGAGVAVVDVDLVACCGVEEVAVDGEGGNGARGRFMLLLL